MCMSTSELSLNKRPRGHIAPLSNDGLNSVQISITVSKTKKS